MLKRSMNDALTCQRYHLYACSGESVLREMLVKSDTQVILDSSWVYVGRYREMNTWIFIRRGNWIAWETSFKDSREISCDIMYVIIVDETAEAL